MIRFENSSRTLRRVPKSTKLAEGEQLVSTDERTGMAIISSPTKQRTKGAVIGTEGWVLDHLNRQEVGNYLNTVADKLVSGLPPDGLRSINFDSL